MNDEPNKKRNSPALALMLAFAPTVMVFAVVGLSMLKLKIKIGNSAGNALLVSFCLVSLACCLTSSFMLFRRRTGPAIVAGIIFFLINGFISLFVGCVALFNQANF